MQWKRDMKFAFIILGENFDSAKDNAQIHSGDARIIGVSSVDEACEVAKRLLNEGISCIELCGAFGESGAKRVIETTENKLPIGYVTHLKEQDDIYRKVFGE